MQPLSRWVSSRQISWMIVTVVLALSMGAGYLALSLERDDDMLAFLPANDPDVVHFRQLATRFGGLDVALVGIDAGAENAVYRPAFLRSLSETTRSLRLLREVESAISFANVTDFVADPAGGLITGPLMLQMPKTASEQRALRRKALSRPHVRGQMVSRDGSSAVIYCFLSHGADPRQAAAAIRREVNKHLSSYPRYWGGNPFVSSYIFGAVQRDLRRLMPWAVLAMVLVMLVAFRDWLGTCLALISTGCAIAMTVGLMVLFGEPLNLVLGSMPLILFSVGSAYGIHVLARYYQAVRSGEGAAAAVALNSAGPTVLVAGLTTALSLFSFTAMDLRPMRVFGVFAGVGVLIALALALLFVPAVLNLLRQGSGRRHPELSQRLVHPLVLAVVRRRFVVVGVLLVLLMAAGVAISRVENRIDSTNLFAKGSPPAQAERFLGKHFGGSQFMQIAVEGDMNQPHVLRELVFLADRLRALPFVASVTHIGDAIARANDAMEGQERIPDTATQVKGLHAFVQSEPAVRQLMTSDYKAALLQVKLGIADARALERALEAVEQLVGGSSIVRRFRLVSATDKAAQPRLVARISARIRTVLAQHDLVLDAQQAATLRRALVERPLRQVSRARVAKRLSAFIRSDEFAADLPPTLPDGGAPGPALSRTLSTLAIPPKGREARARWQAELRTAIATALKVERESSLAADVMLSLQVVFPQILIGDAARERSEQVLKALGVSAPKSARDAVAAALLSLRERRVLLEHQGGALALSFRVNGMPTIHRALAKSALRNQVSSLAWALVPVLLVVSLVFRSLVAGLLVSVPTLLTLVFVFGGMGLFGVRLDIGTAMLACIILGAGVDYGVHFLAAWRGSSVTDAAAAAATSTGGAIWTNALTVCLGFFVLTAGEARPLHNVGLLTSVAMLGAALATFIAIPALARRRHYGALAVNDPPVASVLEPSPRAPTGPMSPLMVDRQAEGDVADR